jgi:tRNA pseudouridine38-40 synthase
LIFIPPFSVFLQPVVYRYFIKISFDGTRYNGWQVQKNSEQTVQQKINDGLSKVLSEKIEVFGCCRTDAGVHARELYAHFDSVKNSLSSIGMKFKKEGSIKIDWLHKFNSILPVDISIDEIISVRGTANARFDARARTYQYFIHSRKNPFLDNRSYYFYNNLDIAMMNQAGKLLISNQDFSSFSKVNTQVKTNNCKLSKAIWTKSENGIVLTIRANRFLHGMVRMIVGTMMLIGKHKITLADFKKIIDSKNCQNAGASVPACGLYLTKVEFPKKVFLK